MSDYFFDEDMANHAIDRIRMLHAVAPQTPIGALLILALPAVATADDLTGSQMILCTAVQVTMCTDDGDCAIEAPWNLNVPQFIEINLKDKKMSTTRASGENRSTPIRTLERDGGLIFLQGIEAGRAYSFVIGEKSGMASIAGRRR